MSTQELAEECSRQRQQLNHNKEVVANVLMDLWALEDRIQALIDKADETIGIQTREN